jgi:hypothetical protein
MCDRGCSPFAIELASAGGQPLSVAALRPPRPQRLGPRIPRPPTPTPIAATTMPTESFGVLSCHAARLQLAPCPPFPALSRRMRGLDPKDGLISCGCRISNGAAYLRVFRPSMVESDPCAADDGWPAPIGSAAGCRNPLARGTRRSTPKCGYAEEPVGVPGRRRNLFRGHVLRL